MPRGLQNRLQGVGSLPGGFDSHVLPPNRLRRSDAMTKKELLRGLPKIDEVLKQESLVVLSEEKGDLLVTDAVRAVIATL